MKRLSKASIVVCGAGAIGSNLVVNCLRMGITKLKVIDKDRVEEHNIGTQIYGMEDVGAVKVDILRNVAFRELAEEIAVMNKELTASNAEKLLSGHALVVDSFDNTASRQAVKDACLKLSVDCLHVGVNDRYAEIIWNEKYRVPSDAGLDVCDYPLARNLIILAVAVASEVVIQYLLNGAKRNFSITLDDMRINEEISL